MKKCHVGKTNLGKPIKLNSTISDALEKITGSKNPDKWVNVPVTFYVDTKVKFGKSIVDAIRIKAQVGAKPAPPAEKPTLVLNSEAFNKAKLAVEAGTFDLAKLKTYYTITEEVQIALGL